MLDTKLRCSIRVSGELEGDGLWQFVGKSLGEMGLVRYNTGKLGEGGGGWCTPDRAYGYGLNERRRYVEGIR